MGGSRSSSTQDFQEAIRESEGEKATANGGAPMEQTTEIPQTQIDPSQQQPTS